MQPSLRLRVHKRVLISLCQQWLMKRHKTKVNNIFEVGKVYCERKTFSFLTNLTVSLGHLWASVLYLTLRFSKAATTRAIFFSRR